MGKQLPQPFGIGVASVGGNVSPAIGRVAGVALGVLLLGAGARLNDVNKDVARKHGS